jgi:hypothetical protein
MVIMLTRCNIERRARLSKSALLKEKLGSQLLWRVRRRSNFLNYRPPAVTSETRPLHLPALPLPRARRPSNFHYCIPLVTTKQAPPHRLGFHLSINLSSRRLKLSSARYPLFRQHLSSDLQSRRLLGKRQFIILYQVPSPFDCQQRSKRHLVVALCQTRSLVACKCCSRIGPRRN